MLNTILKNSIQVLAMAMILACSLLVGIALQQMSVGFAIMSFGVGIAWILGAIGTGMSMARTLVFLATLFIKPFELFFYFALMLLLLCMVIDFYKQPRAKLVLPFPIAFFILTVFGVIGLTKTTVPMGVTYFSATIIAPIVIFMAIANIKTSARDLEVWMRAMVIIGVFLGIYGVIIAILNPNDRLGSTWTNAMTINGLYTLSFFFALALGFKTHIPKHRVAWILGAVIIFLGMLFTYTRIAMVAVAFGLVLLMLRFKSARKWGIVAIALIPFIIPSSMTQRGTLGTMMDLSILIRLFAWYNAAGIIAQHPLIGIGFSTWSQLYQGMIPLPFLYAQHAHNLVINLLLEIGIIGTGAYLYVIFRTMLGYKRRVLRHGGSFDQYATFVAVASLLVSCLTDIFIQQYTISILFWVTLALMYNISRDSEIDAVSDTAQ